MRAINLSKKIIIFAVAIISLIVFGVFIYKNMGLKSKASGSGVATITYSQNGSNPLGRSQVVTIGLTITANNSNKLSAIDLNFENPEDTLEYYMPDATTPLENATTKAFDETVRMVYSTRTDDGTKKLERLVMVAKRPVAQLKSVATIQLRFRLRQSLTTLPATTFFRVNTTSSVIVGPGINGNIYTIQPTNAALPLTLSSICNGVSCTGDQVCYQNVCRQLCSSSNTCTGDYTCTSGVCIPGAPSGGGGSSSYAPTATPYPTAGPNAADLIFKVKIPDLSSGINIIGNVKLWLRDGGNPIEDKIIMLQRIQGTDFFITTSPVSFTNVTVRKEYTLFVKHLKSIRHSYSVTLERGKTVDCTTGTSCGSLANSGLAPLYMGDTDGFNDGSAGTTRSNSFNHIDETDRQKMIQQYGVSSLPTEPNADFNLDGKIDVFDVGILGKNYGKPSE